VQSIAKLRTQPRCGTAFFQAVDTFKSRISALAPSFLTPMLKKTVTAYRLYQEGGVKNLYGYLWLKLQYLTQAHRTTVHFDGCTFSLEGIADESMRAQLFTNNYEAAERRAVARYLRRDLPVVELGGSMGVVACVTNKLLKNKTAHVVVEANPLAIPHLELNRQLNHCEFEIVNKAIAYGVDSVTFRPSRSLCGNSITTDGDLLPVTVQTSLLSELVRHRNFDRFNLVCDIEGLEYDLVCNESDILLSADTIIMETHERYVGEEKLRFMMRRLKELGFTLIDETGFVIVLRK
jgi:FkbM family methyltransferase